MSTRATVHFTYGKNVEAIVYRHSDGYEAGLGKDLETFLDVIEKLNDTRFSDPAYLAAKFVVWQTLDYCGVDADGKPTNPLAVIGVGLVMSDPGDIEYRYLVDCSTGKRPNVKCQKVPFKF